jgi:hypothetical protein
MGGCLAVLVLLVSCCLSDQGRRAPDSNPVPVIPFPKAEVGPRYGIVTEVAMTGLTQRFQWRDKNENWPLHELAVGRGVEQRSETILKESDCWRTTLITRPKGGGVGADVYLASSWLVRLEVTATPAGPRASLRLHHFPQEGVVIGVGLDTRCGPSAHRAIYFDDDLAAGTRLMFYLFARAFVASAVERVVERVPLVAGFVGSNRAR